MEKFSLKGRTAVVTGGGQGIGFACSQALGEAGVKVVVADMVPERAKEAVERLRKLGISAAGETLDVTDSMAVEALAQKLDVAGGVQVLVNNAGVARSNVGPNTQVTITGAFRMDSICMAFFGAAARSASACLCAATAA